MLRRSDRRTVEWSRITTRTVLPVGAAVLVMAVLLVVIAYLTGRHAGARVSTST